MMFLLQIGNQVVPEQTPEVILNRCGGPVYSVLACALALCTVTREAQVGQKGMGKADQMQVCNCGPIGAVLVVTQPQQLLTVFEEKFHRPAAFVRLDQPSRRLLRESVTNPRIFRANPLREQTTCKSPSSQAAST
jgi:hypothetical protein